MIDRSSPAHVLRAAIAQIELEITIALVTCPSDQRVQVEALRERLARLKAEVRQSETRQP